MIKPIPQYNYTIRPFKAYKSWSFASGSEVVLMTAQNTTIYTSSADVSLSNGIHYNKHSLYGQLKSQFYTDVDNPFFRVGMKSTQPASVSGERVFNNDAKLLSIPIRYIGEGIKVGSLTLTDSATSIIYTDNTSGSLMSGSTIVGDVFYKQGVITYTHTASLSGVLTANWVLSYKSTETIYEHEILASIESDEFNTSTNPTAVKEVGTVREQFVDSDDVTHIVTTIPGTKYVRRNNILPNGDTLDFRYGSNVTNGVSGGFEHGERSGSVDSTGSFLAPFITTIGLYDNDLNMVAVAKLPTPIKREPDMPINFIIRFDT